MSKIQARDRAVLTHYSDTIPGNDGNYNWPVKFDKTRGFIGINQTTDDGKIERVLLSPSQYRALMAFGQRRTA